uniref:Formamidopyrimidine-DNA glycosylase catalytic domain-containing protein n=1 Tax=Pseudo-nitzschia australis TaxID=44445 RepID=A0A7S4ADJ1_9STRA|mmetsp:Transcript_25280/g.53826  ORF Transcript_25280/g.53826 Transcript_25280/m.53826 type:complete len:468 (+) Transcript_25280:114-1517(+)
MPELPEVQNFRRLLLPLISKEHPLKLERCSLEKKPPRKFIDDDEIESVHSGEFLVSDVLRKGKLICMVLVSKKDNDNANKPKGRKKQENSREATGSTTATAMGSATTKYLFLHMGMTGRISTPECIPKLQELADTNVYPPPYTYLQLAAGPKEACFSDPRKFGAVFLKDELSEEFGVLAPDALINTNVNINVNTRRPVAVKQEADREDDSDGGVDGDGDDNSLSAIVADEAILGKLTHQSMGIKGILLDQKRAVCGVGNWVADEVLYQTKMHPDQNYLTREQAMVLVHRLHVILDVAVQCLSRDEEYPREWLFHYRWSKRGSKNTTIKDAEGRSIVFVTSGGRTSAVVPSIQKQKSQKPAKTSSSSSSSSRKQPRAKESAKKKKPTTINTTTSPLEASQRPPAIKSEENSKNTKKKTIIKTTPTIKKEKINDPREARNSGQKRKNAPGEAAVAIRRGTRRSPRFAKS